MMVDLIIKNGTIIDGTGTDAFIADIAIKGDKIIAIGKLDGMETERLIDASGQCVSPGLVDIHTHTDFTIQFDNRAESQIRLGVTTEVIGLCGASLAPCTEESRKEILGQLHLSGTWTNFGSYLEALDACKPATNLACMVGHGTLRTIVMPATMRSRLASQSEIESMQEYLNNSLLEGAFGLTTGLEYYPGKAASANELEQLCTLLTKYNALHACHTRNRDLHGLSGYLEVLEVARNSGSKLQISHINCKYGRHNKNMERALEMINWMRQDGVTVGMDVIPSHWNHSHLSALLPSWALDLSPADLIKVIQDPQRKNSLTENHEPFMQLHVLGQWDKIYIFGADKTKRYIGASIADIAKEKSCTGWDAVFSLFEEEEGKLGSLIFAGKCFPIEDVETVLADPYCAVCSDGAATSNDGPTKNIKISPDTFTWSERFIREFVQDKKLLSLSEAIRRMTSLPASQIGLEKRGTLAEGFYADILIMNPEQLNDTATFENPTVYPQGINTVIVNGKIALHENVRSSEHSGEVLRAR